MPNQAYHFLLNKHVNVMDKVYLVSVGMVMFLEHVQHLISTQLFSSKPKPKPLCGTLP